MILVHHLLKEIVDIQLGTAIYYRLYLVEQFLEVYALGISDIVKGYLTVNALDDLYLQHRLLGNGTYTEVYLSLYLVLLAVFCDEVNELLGVRLFHLTLTHSLDILKLIESHRIISGHLIDAHILEDDIWRTLHTLRHLLTEVTEHSTQCGIKGSSTSIMVGRGVVVIAELGVLDNHKRLR